MLSSKKEVFKFNTIEEVLEDVVQGKMIIIVDDEDRENEGDLFIAAEKVNAEAINTVCVFASPDQVLH